MAQCIELMPASRMQVVRLCHPPYCGVGCHCRHPDDPAVLPAGQLLEPVLCKWADHDLHPVCLTHVPPGHLSAERQVVSMVPRDGTSIPSPAVHALVGFARREAAAGVCLRQVSSGIACVVLLSLLSRSYGRWHEGRTKLQLMTSAWLDSCVKVRGAAATSSKRQLGWCVVLLRRQLG